MINTPSEEASGILVLLTKKKLDMSRSTWVGAGFSRTFSEVSRRFGGTWVILHQIKKSKDAMLLGSCTARNTWATLAVLRGPQDHIQGAVDGGGASFRKTECGAVLRRSSLS